MSVKELQTTQGAVYMTRAIVSIESSIRKLEEQRDILVKNREEYLRFREKVKC